MVRRPLALVLPSLVATLAVMVPVGPASAHAGTVPDPAGDAPSYGDLREVRAHNGPHRLGVTIRLTRFEKGRTSAYGVIQRGGDRSGLYLAGWTQDPAFPRHAFLARYTGAATLEPVRCPQLRVAVSEARGTVVTSVPQRCLGQAGGGRVRVTALTESPRGRDLDDSRSLRLSVS